jgi:hypothetical protein
VKRLLTLAFVAVTAFSQNASVAILKPDETAAAAHAWRKFQQAQREWELVQDRLAKKYGKDWTGCGVEFGAEFSVISSKPCLPYRYYIPAGSMTTVPALGSVDSFNTPFITSEAPSK